MVCRRLSGDPPPGCGGLVWSQVTRSFGQFSISGSPIFASRQGSPQALRNGETHAVILAYKNRRGEPLIENKPLSALRLQSAARFAAPTGERRPAEGRRQESRTGIRRRRDRGRFDLYLRSCFLRGCIT